MGRIIRVGDAQGDDVALPRSFPDQPVAEQLAAGPAHDAPARPRLFYCFLSPQELMSFENSSLTGSVETSLSERTFEVFTQFQQYCPYGP